MLSTKSKPQTKSAKVIALLSRAKGATLDEICQATNWKSHSVRAFLTGLRKKGFVLTREQRGDDGTAYRITQNPQNEDGKGAA
jgi:predicted ArsR family transcriptional regulator